MGLHCLSQRRATAREQIRQRHVPFFDKDPLQKQKPTTCTTNTGEVNKNANKERVAVER